MLIGLLALLLFIPLIGSTPSDVPSDSYSSYSTYDNTNNEIGNGFDSTSCITSPFPVNSENPSLPAEPCYKLYPEQVSPDQVAAEFTIDTVCYERDCQEEIDSHGIVAQSRDWVTVMGGHNGYTDEVPAGIIQDLSKGDYIKVNDPIGDLDGVYRYDFEVAMKIGSLYGPGMMPGGYYFATCIGDSGWVTLKHAVKVSE